MRWMILVALSTLAVSACKKEQAAAPIPVDLSAEAVGYYCQMDLLEHDGPKGQIHLQGMPAPIFFSQVRDAIAYLHMPEQSHAVTATYVQDMAGAESWGKPAGWIAATDAFYVIGSDVMGGMGAPEFVPFSDPARAEDFIADHGGELRRFDDIAAPDVLQTEAPQTASTSDMASRLKALTGKTGSN